MSEFADLDSIANNRLSEEQAWQASRVLGDYALELIQTETPEDKPREVYYRFHGLDEELCGVSEQPDLTGPKGLTLYYGSGEWIADRRAGLYDKRVKRSQADYIGFQVEHVATYQPLLRMPLAPSDVLVPLLQKGRCVNAFVSSSQRGILDEHNKGSAVIYPRQVQAAAAVLRHIIRAQIPATLESYCTPEEEKSFLDKHFPYMDVVPTGGGDPVRVRVNAAYARSAEKHGKDEKFVAGDVPSRGIVDLELSAKDS